MPVEFADLSKNQQGIVQSREPINLVLAGRARTAADAEKPLSYATAHRQKW